MLYFSTRPGPIFTAILHEAMRELIAKLTDPSLTIAEVEERWRDEYPHASESFSVPLAVYTLLRLLAASKSTGVYRLTDYHWLLLYDCLREYCDWHNDYAAENPDKVLPVGSYHIGEIDFEEIVQNYFWDEDFLVEMETVEGLGPAGRNRMDLTDEAFAIAQKLPPHRDELRLGVRRSNSGDRRQSG